MKLIVYTGEYAEYGEVTSDFTHADLQLEFPEIVGTNRGLVLITNFLAESLSNKENNLVFCLLTRNSEYVNHVGTLIDAKILNANDVEIRLCLEYGKYTTHYFDNEGMIDTKWPYGCLMVDTITATHNLLTLMKKGS